MAEKLMKNPFQLVVVDLEELPKKWGWLLALGISMLVAGSIGLVMVVAVTLATVLFYGGLLLVGGVFALVHAVRTKEDLWHGKMGHILTALLYILAGVLVLMNPVAASAVFTLLLGGFMLFIGALRIAYGIRCRKNGWKWLLPTLMGLINIIFAVIIASSWPVSGLWVIGLFVSVEMVMNGWLMVLTALAVRKLADSDSAGCILK
ncbi:HdeD family acid-resistance protein [Desulfomarina sp.]